MGSSITTAATGVEISKLIEKARNGDTNAMVALGQAYTCGDYGVPVDRKKAFMCYKKAADLGNADGQQHTAMHYISGKYIPKDENMGVHYLRKAAAQGDRNAQCWMGWAYRDGYGDLKISVKKAVSYLEKSAEQGCVTAQFDLGRLYFCVIKGRTGMNHGIYWLCRAYKNKSMDAYKLLKKIETDFPGMMDSVWFHIDYDIKP